MPAAVEAKPYEAECEWVVVEKRPDGRTLNTTRTGMVARDSSGRRAEHYDPIQPAGGQRSVVLPDNIYDPAQPLRIVDGELFRMANIYDPVALTWHVFDLQSGTTLIYLPITAGRDESGLEILSVEIQGMPVPLTMWFARQTGDSIIGRKVIEGMDCTGYYREVGGWKMELWIADDLQETIRLLVTAADLEITIRLYDIWRTEPDPQFFVAPSADRRPGIEDAYFVPLK